MIRRRYCSLHGGGFSIFGVFPNFYFTLLYIVGTPSMRMPMHWAMDLLPDRKGIFLEEGNSLPELTVEVSG